MNVNKIFSDCKACIYKYVCDNDRQNCQYFQSGNQRVKWSDYRIIILFSPQSVTSLYCTALYCTVLYSTVYKGWWWWVIWSLPYFSNLLLRAAVEFSIYEIKEIRITNFGKYRPGPQPWYYFINNKYWIFIHKVSK